MLHKPQWIVVNRKLLWSGLGLIILALLVLTMNMCGRWEGESLPPEVLFTRALDQTAGAETFRYRMQVGVGREERLSMVDGVHVAPDRFQITGTMQKTPLEFIHIAGVTYMKDPWSEGWLTIPESSLAMTQLFIAELNPLGNLDFKAIPEIKKLGRKTIEGETLMGLEMTPQIDNALLATRYQDFLVRVWIEPDSYYIRSATLEGRGGGGEADRILIELKIWDFNNDDIVINKPPGV